MGVDLASILAGVTGLGNVAGQGMNILQTMENWNRYNERSEDPLFAQLRNQFIGQYNDSPYGPYGDPSDSFGGLFGRDTAGNPVQYGDWAARQYMGMMQNNPAIAAMNVLNQGAQMQSPGMMSLSDLLSGNPGATPSAQTAYVSPTTALPQNLLNPLPDRQVVRAPSQPNPQLNMAERRRATGIWDTLRRFIGGSAADDGQTSTPATPAAPSTPAPARPTGRDTSPALDSYAGCPPRGLIGARLDTYYADQRSQSVCADSRQLCHGDIVCAQDWGVSVAPGGGGNPEGPEPGSAGTAARDKDVSVRDGYA